MNLKSVLFYGNQYTLKFKNLFTLTPKTYNILKISTL